MRFSLFLSVINHITEQSPWLLINSILALYLTAILANTYGGREPTTLVQMRHNFRGGYVQPS